MKNTRIAYLFQKHLDGTLTPEERLELMALVNNGTEDEALQKFMDAYWDEHEDDQQLSPDKASRIFQQVIDLDNVYATGTRKARASWYKWAAAAIFIIGSSALLLFNLRNKPVTRVSMLQAGTHQQHRLIRLPDGSTVILNDNSTLKYPIAFNGSKREVTLTGEGYFDIKHDVSHPFIVHTGKLITTVLGTAFDISAYKNAKTITVTVSRGKVSVSDEHKLLGIITPNQQLAFNKENLNTIQTSTNSNKVIAWQSKDLFFDDMTMQRAADVLERRFNVAIVFTDDSVKNRRFTGTFLHGEKLDDILQVICAFNSATYKIDDDGHILIGAAKQ